MNTIHAHALPVTRTHAATRIRNRDRTRIKTEIRNQLVPALSIDTAVDQRGNLTRITKTVLTKLFNSFNVLDPAERAIFTDEAVSTELLNYSGTRNSTFKKELLGSSRTRIDGTQRRLTTTERLTQAEYDNVRAVLKGVHGVKQQLDALILHQQAKFSATYSGTAYTLARPSLFDSITDANLTPDKKIEIDTASKPLQIIYLLKNIAEDFTIAGATDEDGNIDGLTEKRYYQREMLSDAFALFSDAELSRAYTQLNEHYEAGLPLAEAQQTFIDAVALSRVRNLHTFDADAITAEGERSHFLSSLAASRYAYFSTHLDELLEKRNVVPTLTTLLEIANDARFEPFFASIETEVLEGIDTKLANAVLNEEVNLNLFSGDVLSDVVIETMRDSIIEKIFNAITDETLRESTHSWDTLAPVLTALLTVDANKASFVTYLQNNTNRAIFKHVLRAKAGDTPNLALLHTDLAKTVRDLIMADGGEAFLTGADGLDYLKVGYSELNKENADRAAGDADAGTQADDRDKIVTAFANHAQANIQALLHADYADIKTDLLNTRKDLLLAEDDDLNEAFYTDENANIELVLRETLQAATADGGHPLRQAGHQDRIIRRIQLYKPEILPTIRDNTDNAFDLLTDRFKHREKERFINGDKALFENPDTLLSLKAINTVLTEEEPAAIATQILDEFPENILIYLEDTSDEFASINEILKAGLKERLLDNTANSAWLEHVNAIRFIELTIALFTEDTDDGDKAQLAKILVEKYATNLSFVLENETLAPLHDQLKLAIKNSFLDDENNLFETAPEIRNTLIKASAHLLSNEAAEDEAPSEIKVFAQKFLELVENPITAVKSLNTGPDLSPERLAEITTAIKECITENLLTLAIEELETDGVTSHRLSIENFIEQLDFAHVQFNAAEDEAKTAVLTTLASAHILGDANGIRLLTDELFIDSDADAETADGSAIKRKFQEIIIDLIIANDDNKIDSHPEQCLELLKLALPVIETNNATLTTLAELLSTTLPSNIKDYIDIEDAGYFTAILRQKICENNAGSEESAQRLVERGLADYILGEFHAEFTDAQKEYLMTACVKHFQADRFNGAVSLHAYFFGEEHHENLDYFHEALKGAVLTQLTTSADTANVVFNTPEAIKLIEACADKIFEARANLDNDLTRIASFSITTAPELAVAILDSEILADSIKEKIKAAFSLVSDQDLSIINRKAVHSAQQLIQHANFIDLFQRIVNQDCLTEGAYAERVLFSERMTKLALNIATASPETLLAIFETETTSEGMKNIIAATAVRILGDDLGGCRKDYFPADEENADKYHALVVASLQLEETLDGYTIEKMRPLADYLVNEGQDTLITKILELDSADNPAIDRAQTSLKESIKAFILHDNFINFQGEERISFNLQQAAWEVFTDEEKTTFFTHITSPNYTRDITEYFTEPFATDSNKLQLALFSEFVSEAKEEKEQRLFKAEKFAELELFMLPNLPDNLRHVIDEAGGSIEEELKAYVEGKIAYTETNLLALIAADKETEGPLHLGIVQLVKHILVNAPANVDTAKFYASQAKLLIENNPLETLDYVGNDAVLDIDLEQERAKQTLSTNLLTYFPVSSGDNPTFLNTLRTERFNFIRPELTASLKALCIDSENTTTRRATLARLTYQLFDDLVTHINTTVTEEEDKDTIYRKLAKDLQHIKPEPSYLTPVLTSGEEQYRRILNYNLLEKSLHLCEVGQSHLFKNIESEADARSTIDIVIANANPDQLRQFAENVLTAIQSDAFNFSNMLETTVDSPANTAFKTCLANTFCSFLRQDGFRKNIACKPIVRFLLALSKDRLSFEEKVQFCTTLIQTKTSDRGIRPHDLLNDEAAIYQLSTAYKVASLMFLGRLPRDTSSKQKVLAFLQTEFMAADGSLENSALGKLLKTVLTLTEVELTAETDSYNLNSLKSKLSTTIFELAQLEADSEKEDRTGQPIKTIQVLRNRIIKGQSFTELRPAMAKTIVNKWFKSEGKLSSSAQEVIASEIKSDNQKLYLSLLFELAELTSVQINEIAKKAYSAELLLEIMTDEAHPLKTLQTDMLRYAGSSNARTLAITKLALTKKPAMLERLLNFFITEDLNDSDLTNRIRIFITQLPEAVALIVNKGEPYSRIVMNLLENGRVLGRYNWKEHDFIRKLLTHSECKNLLKLVKLDSMTQFERSQYIMALFELNSPYVVQLMTEEDTEIIQLALADNFSKMEVAITGNDTQFELFSRILTEEALTDQRDDVIAEKGKTDRYAFAAFQARSINDEELGNIVRALATENESGKLNFNEFITITDTNREVCTKYEGLHSQAFVLEFLNRADQTQFEQGVNFTNRLETKLCRALLNESSSIYLFKGIETTENKEEIKLKLKFFLQVFSRKATDRTPIYKDFLDDLDLAAQNLEKYVLLTEALNELRKEKVLRPDQISFSADSLPMIKLISRATAKALQSTNREERRKNEALLEREKEAWAHFLVKYASNTLTHHLLTETVTDGGLDCEPFLDEHLYAQVFYAMVEYSNNFFSSAELAGVANAKGKQVKYLEYVQRAVPDPEKTAKTLAKKVYNNLSLATHTDKSPRFGYSADLTATNIAREKLLDKFYTLIAKDDDELGFHYPLDTNREETAGASLSDIESQLKKQAALIQRRYEKRRDGISVAAGAYGLYCFGTAAINAVTGNWGGALYNSVFAIASLSVGASWQFKVSGAPKVRNFLINNWVMDKVAHYVYAYTKDADALLEQKTSKNIPYVEHFIDESLTAEPETEAYENDVKNRAPMLSALGYAAGLCAFTAAAANMAFTSDDEESRTAGTSMLWGIASTAVGALWQFKAPIQEGGNYLIDRILKFTGIRVTQVPVVLAEDEGPSSDEESDENEASVEAVAAGEGIHDID